MKKPADMVILVESAENLFNFLTRKPQRRNRDFPPVATGGAQVFFHDLAQLDLRSRHRHPLHHREDSCRKGWLRRFSRTCGKASPIHGRRRTIRLSLRRYVPLHRGSRLPRAKATATSLAARTPGTFDPFARAAARSRERLRALDLLSRSRARQGKNTG